MTAAEFEEQAIGIHEVDVCSPIRQRRLAEPNDEAFLTLVQFTVKNVAVILNLAPQKPFFVEMLSELDQFKYPLYFSSTGFTYATPT